MAEGAPFAGMTQEQSDNARLLARASKLHRGGYQDDADVGADMMRLALRLDELGYTIAKKK